LDCWVWVSPVFPFFVLSFLLRELLSFWSEFLRLRLRLDCESVDESLEPLRLRLERWPKRLEPEPKRLEPEPKLLEPEPKLLEP
jgi:hypothetical protein